MDQILTIPTIISLIVGGLAGWLAARITKRGFFGELTHVAVGMVGGFVGAWIWNHSPLAPESPDWFHTAAAAAVASIVLLAVWRLARR